jgi:hypothetical protein
MKLRSCSTSSWPTTTGCGAAGARRRRRAAVGGAGRGARCGHRHRRDVAGREAAFGQRRLGRWSRGRGRRQRHHLVHADVHAAAGQGELRATFLGHVEGVAAAQLRREALGGHQQFAARAAQADRVEALVLRRAFEQRAQALAAMRQQRFGDGVAERVGHQHAAAVEVAAEPAQRDLVEQRHRQRGRQHQHQRQRQQEAQLQAQRTQRHRRCGAAGPKYMGTNV